MLSRDNQVTFLRIYAAKSMFNKVDMRARRFLCGKISQIVAEDNNADDFNDFYFVAVGSVKKSYETRRPLFRIRATSINTTKRAARVHECTSKDKRAEQQQHLEGRGRYRRRRQLSGQCYQARIFANFDEM